MKSLVRMIDKAAALCGSKSEVARRLGVSPQTLWNWESGSRSMPNEHIDALAHLIGADPIKALGEYHHERMRKKTAGSVLAGTAAVACFLGVAFGGGSDANAATPLGRDGVYKLHIMRSVARALQRFASSLRRADRRKAAPTCSPAALATC